MKIYRIKKNGQGHWAKLEGADKLVVLDTNMNPSREQAKLGDAGLTVLPAGDPQNFLALWNNSRVACEHLKRTVPTEALYFMKPQSCLSGHEAKVAHPGQGHTMILEAELGIVIGRKAKDVPLEDVSKVVLGYTCINDFTARNVVGKDKSFPQYTRAKGFDGFGGVGPYVETTRPDPEARIRGFINGRMVQDYPVKDLIIQPEELVAYFSRQMTLQPGDVIACGTSLGAEPVVAGDTVDVTVDGIGLLRSYIV
jgi:2-keto-4-pentenoate hydratase/2-oxohepta-3-ene-1,7-dioic acid hydratase in catechol pathway